MSDRAARVWARIVAAQDDDTPVSVAALCRAAVLMLGVDGASVTATSGPAAGEPVCASDDVSARLEELQFTMGEGPGADDLRVVAEQRGIDVVRQQDAGPEDREHPGQDDEAGGGPARRVHAQ